MDQRESFIPEDGSREPSVPFVRSSETSRAAADSIRAKAPTDEERVLAFITGREREGATDDEIEENLGLIHQNASARRRALQLAGKIAKTDRARMTRHHRWAYVYVLPIYLEV